MTHRTMIPGLLYSFRIDRFSSCSHCKFFLKLAMKMATEEQVNELEIR